MSYTKDRIAAAGFIVLALAVVFLSRDLPFNSLIFPRMIAGIMALCAVLMFLRTVSFTANKAPAAAEDPKRDTPFFRNPKNFVITFGAFIVYLLVIDYLGYFVSTAILALVLAPALGFRKIPALLVTVALFLALVYVIFILVFERPLPQGIFY